MERAGCIGRATDVHFSRLRIRRLDLNSAIDALYFDPRARLKIETLPDLVAGDAGMVIRHSDDPIKTLSHATLGPPHSQHGRRNHQPDYD
jgi:hypothetical protein